MLYWLVALAILLTLAAAWLGAAWGRFEARYDPDPGLIDRIDVPRPPAPLTEFDRMVLRASLAIEEFGRIVYAAFVPVVEAAGRAIEEFVSQLSGLVESED